MNDGIRDRIRSRLVDLLPPLPGDPEKGMYGMQIDLATVRWLADHLEQAERDKAAVERVRALCDDYHLISTDDIASALDGTEDDR